MRAVSKLIKIPELVGVLDGYGLVVRPLPAVVREHHGEVVTGPVLKRLELGRGVIVLEVEFLNKLVNVTVSNRLNKIVNGHWVLVGGTPVRVNVVVKEPVIPGN